MRIQQLTVGPIAANAYIVSGGGGSLLIDAGDDPERILRACGEIGVMPSAILLTHGHFDHILAAPILRERTGAKIYIGIPDAAMPGDAALNLYSPQAANTPFVPFDADETLCEDEIELCGFSLSVLRTPGHTPGGLSYYFPEESALFTGDTLFDGGSVGRTDLPGGDARALYDSIAKLLRLPDDARFYPGHGSGSTIGRARRVFL